MRPGGGILESDDILAKDRGKGAPRHPPLYCNDGSKFERKIIQTLAGLKFDFDLLLLGFHPEPRPLGAIPGQWSGRAIDRLVIRDGTRKQPIFTGRKVVECETPIIVH